MLGFFTVGRGWKKDLNKMDSKWYLVKLESALGPVEKWGFFCCLGRNQDFCFRKCCFPATLHMFFEGWRLCSPLGDGSVFTLMLKKVVVLVFLPPLKRVGDAARSAFMVFPGNFLGMAWDICIKFLTLRAGICPESPMLALFASSSRRSSCCQIVLVKLLPICEFFVV